VWRLLPELRWLNWLLHHYNTFEDKIERPPLQHNWDDQGSAEHPHRKSSSMRLTNGRSTGNGAYTRKGTTLRVMVASRSKVSFWPNGSTSPGNYGWLNEWMTVWVHWPLLWYHLEFLQDICFFFCVLDPTEKIKLKLTELVTKSDFLEKYRNSVIIFM
jgi:hypothetical protein